MKKVHILLLIVIAAATGIVISAMGGSSEYVDSQTASNMSAGGKKVHVVGTLPRDGQGHIVGIEYNPLQDPNFIAFRLIDEKQKEFKVVCFNPPTSMTDFKRSEKVVVNGSFKDNQFVADEILLKCPSKYENNKLETSTAALN